MENNVVQKNMAGDAGIVETAGVSRFSFVWIIIFAALVVGILLAILWSPAIADDAIGENIANTIVGSTAKTVPLDTTLFGFVFALAAGLGTTFTACNCVVFSCIAPLAGENKQSRMSIGRLLLFMCAGVIIITAIYGIVGAILGDRMPSLSSAVVHLSASQSYPLRLLQSTVVFVIVGVVLWLWGIFALQIVKNPLQRVIELQPWIVPFFLGVIVGCFTVGRPFPLFQKLFQFSSGQGNILLSALLIAIQGLGNIALMALIFILLTRGSRGRFERWLQANPLRARTITALSMIGGGTFLIIYWGVRVPAAFGIGWFPHFF